MVAVSVALLSQLRAVLDGEGPALALGMDERVVLPEGTGVAIRTSGSTGILKTVLLSREALVCAAQATADRIGHGRWLLAMSPSYVAGLGVLVRSILAGTEPVTLEPGPFTPEAFVAGARALSGAGARYTSLVPTQLARLLAAAENDPSVRAAVQSFDTILLGGQAMPVTLREGAAAIGARVVRTYGSTETCGGCVYDGVPLRGVRVQVSAGGEVELAGGMLATGYLRDPQRTAAAFHHDTEGTRWYRTGDAGAFSAGALRITGRVDNVIVSGGVNVSLDRVEAVVQGVPGLAGAVVIAAADETWGQTSVVFVDRAMLGSADASERLAAARQAVQEQVGVAARPSRIIVQDGLPVLASGKPDRARLRALTQLR